MNSSSKRNSPRRPPPAHATASARSANTKTTLSNTKDDLSGHTGGSSRRNENQLDPDDNAQNSDGSLSGFSPNALSDRYSAEIDHTTRQKEKMEEEEAIPPPPTTSLTSQTSMFWRREGSPETPDTQSEREMSAARSKATKATKQATAKKQLPSSRSSTSSEQFDLDVEDNYGRPAHLRRKQQPKGGVFGQKAKFEHVDQSNNIMAMRRDDDDDGGGGAIGDTTPAGLKKAASTGSVIKRPTRTGRFGTTSHTKSKGRRSVLRTISLEFTEIALGRSFRGFSKNSDSNSKALDSATIAEEDDDEEYEEISVLACCGCCCFLVFLVVIVLFMAGVIPLPEQWNDVPTFPSIPGLTAEKGGEDSGSWDPESTTGNDTNTGQSITQRLHSPAPSPDHSHDSDRWDEIESIVIRAHLSRAEDLVDAYSIQHKALTWLSDVDTFRSEEEGNNSEAVATDDFNQGILERYALAVFFFATHEHTNPLTTDVDRQVVWNNKEPDDLDIMSDESLKAAFEYSPEKKLRTPSNSEAEEETLKVDWHHRTGWLSRLNICEWYGVQCHRSGRVSAIELSHNQLRGIIPRELWALSELQHLNLSKNHLQRQLPAILWKPAAWAELITLDLSYNRLTGQLPVDIGSGFGLLENMTLAGNNLDGQLPTSIAQLTSLKVLNLQENNFTGSIQDTSTIPNLRVLRLGNNRLDGDFPFSLTQNRNLIELSLDCNQLDGTLPPELDSLHQLRHLKLGSNKFEGPIPDVFGRLHNLQVLELQNNRLGEHHDEQDTPAKMPQSIGLLSDLITMKLNTNSIHGDIPDEWWNLTKLEIFHLFDNDFVGSIPTAIGGFSSLQDLQLQDSLMSGVLPTQLGNLTKLESLRIYNARFTGIIPGQICERHKDIGEEDSDTGKNLALLAADCQVSVECTCCDRCY